MSIIKQLKDHIVKICWDGKTVPSGLFELSQYFKNNGPIEFEYKKEGGKIIAISKNFRYGSIITSVKFEKDLDKSIEDAILTSFDVPSSYATEAGVYKLDDNKKMVYASA
jgi:hypothetical protein